MAMQLGDDGTLDTVIVCSECGTEFRYNFDGAVNTDGTPMDGDAPGAEVQYDAFVEESIADAEKIHLCAIGYAHWASYLINGDATGFDIANTPDDPKAGDREQAQADAFAAYLGAPIVDVSESHFFATPDAGADLPGDCVHYIALVS